MSAPAGEFALADIERALLPFVADSAHRERLARYCALLLERNSTVNLTGARTIGSAVEHIADALTVAPFVEESLVDVGSGGGLPGIPLGIVCDVPVTLIESTLKKARFLEEAALVAGVRAEVVALRAEDAAREERYREQFACATCRAVGSLSTVLELTMPFLKVGGVALLQRGHVEDAERVAASDAALVLGAEPSGERALDPGRNLLFYTKRFPTPARFPRRAGIPVKRPLGTGRPGRPAA